MLHFFSSKYIVAALAMMAMTMTYNINNRNGVVNAEDACKAVPDLEVCTSESCTCKSHTSSVAFYCVLCRERQKERERDRVVRDVYYFYSRY